MKKLNMKEYQKWVCKVWSGNSKAKFDLRDDFIMTVGLAGEAGEVLELLKKRIRDNKLDKAELIKELGDVLYYWTMICNRFDLNVEDVMNTNVAKLEERYKNRKT